MANPEHVQMLLHKGVQRWNFWRLTEPDIRPDLYAADLSGAILRGADLSEANLIGANLQGTDLRHANLSQANLIGLYLQGMDLSQANFRGADLRQVDLRGATLVEAEFTNANLTAANLSGVDFHDVNLVSAYLSYANLSGADLSNAMLQGANFASANLRESTLSGANLREAGFARADLRGAHLDGADLSGACLNFADLSQADLTGASLHGASCLQTNFSHATLVDCLVYGISAWDVNLDGAVQADLRLNPSWDGVGIAVDNMDVAQFLYLLLHNEKMRAILDTINSKVVLILGRFSDECKPVLDALRDALRNHPNGYIPVLFDFEPQADRHVIDTVKTLANLSRFIIADLTDPHVVRTELSLTVPTLPAVPVQPIVQRDAALLLEYTWFRNFPWVQPVFCYTDLSDLLANLDESVISPAEAHVHARRL